MTDQTQNETPFAQARREWIADANRRGRFRADLHDALRPMTADELAADPRPIPPGTTALAVEKHAGDLRDCRICAERAGAELSND